MHTKSHPSEQPSTHNPVEVTRELRDVFTPLCLETAKTATPEQLRTQDPEIMAAVGQFPVHALPTDYAYTRLPWDIFLDKDEHELQQDITDYRNRDVLELEGPFFDNLLKPWRGRHPEGLGERHEIELEYLMRGKKDYGKWDVGAWKRYETTVAQYTPQEQENIAKLQQSRGYNIGKWVPDMRLKQVDRLLHLTNENISENNITSQIALPVGEYGEGFTRDLLRTTALMQAVGQKHALVAAEQATADNEELLYEFTARGAQADKVTPESTMDTLYEGILSISQTIAILTMQKVPDYDDPKTLMKDIVESGLVSRLARFAPMGFVGPMALSGSYIPNCLRRTETGVRFSDTFEAFLKTEKERFMGELAVKAEIARHNAQLLEIQKSEGANYDFTQPHTPQALAKICPVSNIGGGIDALARSAVLLIGPGTRKERKLPKLKGLMSTFLRESQ
jgi:hypothetical protein